MPRSINLVSRTWFIRLVLRSMCGCVCVVAFGCRCCCLSFSLVAAVVTLAPILPVCLSVWTETDASEIEYCHMSLCPSEAAAGVDRAQFGVCPRKEIRARLLHTHTRLFLLLLRQWAGLFSSPPSGPHTHSFKVFIRERLVVDGRGYIAFSRLIVISASYSAAARASSTWARLASVENDVTSLSLPLSPLSSNGEILLTLSLLAARGLTQ